jgi:galactonate dehydratase
VHQDVPWRSDVVDEGFTVDERTRTVTPNTKPGLGVTINEEEVKRHPFEQEIPQRVFHPDGSVGDW